MSHNSEVHVVFSPDRLKDTPPPIGAFVTVVRFTRVGEQFADACAALRDADLPFRIVWISQGGFAIDPSACRMAEIRQAQALASSLSDGQAKVAIVYREKVERVSLSDQETVLEE